MASTSEVDDRDAPNEPTLPTIVVDSQSVGSGRKRPIPVNEDDNIVTYRTPIIFEQITNGCQFAEERNALRYVIAR